MTELLDSGAIFFQAHFTPKSFFIRSLCNPRVGARCRPLYVHFLLRCGWATPFWSRPGVAKIGSMACEKGGERRFNKLYSKGRKAGET